MEPVSLDLEGICAYQQNRPPFLMVDYIEELVPGERVKGYKDLPEDTWFFKVHFPGDPNMPGLLQVEAIVQASALIVLGLEGNKGKVAYLISANNLKFKRKVVPNDRLCLEASLLSFKRGIATMRGCAKVEGQITCEGEFTLLLPHIVNNYKVLGDSAS